MIIMSPPKILDPIDRRILRIVQKDASLSIHEIASRVGLSQTPCWKRLQRLEAAGVIKRRIAILDPIKLGLGITVFVTIEVGDHSGQGLERFATALAAMDEVMDFYRTAGDVDYILRVVVPDTAAFDDFYKRLIALAPLKNVTSRFALENIKSETAFPIAG
ncbi:transcriptional regulator, AsnC family [Methylocella silvestris BL2]|uniref:Transcriptional regulator, AsnC family n=1 Tax=Methylocella silvestris (strain DSM 15510 / CIP 108128 / LMG 27833 / NCIMB 13906 / BL2) TaxID=395965 RepID=B8EP55_METSB|nr:transcriptional regulator, AsnC family [Methylocella silvestris BL2]